ncbi:hypothetical protein ATY37_14880 [Vibrio cidicii]|uniref:Uncharacterized protein n=1 Tax=Vibrio cidicii TaxID=1763883 RepID=A0A151KYJ5_9VIBR|nr:hypothetical protein ATY37_14880 [Vibrio cidicii]
MDIEKRLKALLLLRSRLVWISIGVGIVLVLCWSLKPSIRADAATQAHSTGNKKPSHGGEG